ncbi:hypothetical protein [Pontibacillus yanchengensis]|uniref:Uncharacterized protein n=1 Tax=Pontibacillus yanchengensis Y32 TaxID=1385514 RepID=A0A0A2T6T9_9BACI|nr:hypothetical protein [Pontibacillus yanchengensis]KGP71512.1 hypothetical protein N782_18495 [Pontibacillus yanchengensis Y32]
MTDKQTEIIEEYFAEVMPSQAIEHAIAFGYVKGTDSQITQTMYSEKAGINSRTLRKYIAENKQAYEEELERAKENAEPEIDITSLDSRSLSEEQIDKFIEVLYQSAITGNARDRQLLIDFTGMTATDVMTFQNTKASSLRWFVKSTLSTISKHMDARALGINLAESSYLYRGDKSSNGNAQNFVNADLEDESFKLELMYWGMAFMSLYNQTEHPDIKLLEKAVRLERMEQETAQEINKAEVKKYEAGKDIKADKKPVSGEALYSKLSEIFSDEEIDEIRAKQQEANRVTKPPELDKEKVEQRASQHEGKLEVLLSVEDELKAMMKKADLKNRARKYQQ